MSQLINVSDDVYTELTVLKKIRETSYSQVINGLLQSTKEGKKMIGWSEMIQRAKERDAKYTGKKEIIDHDLLAYGVSRDRS